MIVAIGAPLAPVRPWAVNWIGLPALGLLRVSVTELLPALKTADRTARAVTLPRLPGWDTR